MRSRQADTNKIRTIAGGVSIDGSVLLGTEFQVSKTGTGTYIIRFLPGFRSFLGVSATSHSGAGGGASIDAISPESITVQGRNTASGTAIDIGFYFVATGIAR